MVKLSKQETLLLLALRHGGMFGCHMRDLNSISFRYGARFFDMSRKGFVIEEARIGQGEFKYYLRAEPDGVVLWKETVSDIAARYRDLTAGKA